MRFVAYTIGDAHNKEIYVSLDYMEASASRVHNEILDVLVNKIVTSITLTGRFKQG